jgi:hypothetical protein
VSLQTVPVASSVWDLYDDVHHFTADGFPISKFVTYCVAQRYPDAPMVNGFLGDSLLRGSNDKVSGRSEEEWKGDLAGALQGKHFAISLNLFRHSIAKRIVARSRAPMEDAVQRGAGKVFGWTDLYLRQRCYISNNFLQHLGLSEALLPFYTWSLLSYKMQHDYSVFNRSVYRRIFAERFPSLAEIAHASDIKSTKATQPTKKIARCVRRWARDLVTPSWDLSRLDLLAKEVCVPLVMLAAVGVPLLRRRLNPIVEDAMLTVRRLDLLEQRVRRANVQLDWSRI